jgi:hypothetical protein
LENTRIQSSIHRRDGTTIAERYLKRLCEHSFLSLWSYASVYRDQFDSPTAKIGKEVCDLLVVFENHIIIFSDKDCVYPDGENEELNWRRWYKRAVQKSTEQIWGAERWINPIRSGSLLTPVARNLFPILFLTYHPPSFTVLLWLTVHRKNVGLFTEEAAAL